MQVFLKVYVSEESCWVTDNENAQFYKKRPSDFQQQWDQKTVSCPCFPSSPGFDFISFYLILPSLLGSVLNTFEGLQKAEMCRETRCNDNKDLTQSCNTLIRLLMHFFEPQRKFLPRVFGERNICLLKSLIILTLLTSHSEKP